MRLDGAALAQHPWDPQQAGSDAPKGGPCCGPAPGLERRSDQGRLCADDLAPMVAPQVGGVVLHKGIDAVAPVVEGRRRAPAGGLELVVDDGAGLEDAAPARKLGPPGQVDVLEGEEEVLVQQPDLVQHCRAIGGAPPAGAKDVGPSSELPQVFGPHATVVCQPVGGHVVAGGVEGVAAVEEQHLGGDHSSLGMIVEGLDHGGDPLGVCFGIIVEENVEGAAGGVQPGVAGTGETEVGRLRQDADFGIARDDRKRVVPGGIVDEDDLDVGVGLTAQAIETDRQMLGAVPVGDDDRDSGPGIHLV